MGFIAAMFITYMSEEDSLYALVAVLQRPIAPLRVMYLPDMVQTSKFLFVFNELGKFYLPTLWAHLEKEKVSSSMVLTHY